MAQSDDELLKDAREHMALVMVMESDIREERKKCSQFLGLKQWNDADVTSRGTRPTLVIDQTGQYVDQVVNDWRRNRLGIKVSPGDAQGDEEFAKLIESDIRQCEYQSKAHIAYDWAMWCMTALNAGYFQIYTRRRPGTFKQDFWIRDIPNPDCVYMDQFCQEPDYSDQRICLKTDKLGIRQYKEQYGNTAVIQSFESYVKDQDLSGWLSNESITLGEFWRVLERMRKIQLLTKPIAITRNGQALQTAIVYDDEWTPQQGVEIARNRDGELMQDDEPVREVWQYIVNGVEVLSRTRWSGSIIPIVPMLGKKMYVDGKKRLFALISRALDSQQALNYAVSALVERVGDVPKNPYTVLTGAIKTDLKQWAEMNIKKFTYLQVDPVQLPDGTWESNVGNLARRTDANPYIEQFVLITNLFQQLQKGNIGMYGANLGDREGKTRSGAAERALQQEGDNATFDYLDNGARALELGGKIIVDAWAKVRSMPDILTVRDHAGKVTHVAINQKRETMERVPKGQTRDYLISDAQYHVAVSAAPSNDTKRKEDAIYSMEIYKELPDNQKTPQLTAAMLRHQDSTVAQEMADILDPKDDKEKIPPYVAQQMAVRDKIIEAQTKEINALMDERDAKKLELDANWRDKCLDSWTKLEVAKVNASKDLDKAGAEIEADFVSAAATRAHEVGMAAMQHGQALEQQENAHQQGLETQEQAASLEPEEAATE